VIAGQTEIANVEATIDNLKGFLDHTEATFDFYETKRENLLLEAELAEIEETNKFLLSIKTRLDEVVRRETEKQATEKRQLVERLIRGVMEELKDSKIQDTIMKNCLLSLEKIPAQPQAIL